MPTPTPSSWLVTRQDTSGEVMFFAATGPSPRTLWSISSLEGTRFTEDGADDLIKSLKEAAKLVKQLHVFYNKLPLPE